MVLKEKTPMIKGFKMIKATPARETEDQLLGKRQVAVEDSPMITWGKIEGASYLGGSTYKVPATPIRDEIGNKLANRVASKRREEKAH